MPAACATADSGMESTTEALSAFRAALHKIELENRAPTGMEDAIFRVALRFLAIDPELSLQVLVEGVRVGANAELQAGSEIRPVSEWRRLLQRYMH